MSDAVKIEIRQGLGWAILLIVCAIALIGLNTIRSDGISLFTGLLNLFFGIQMLRQPHYVLRETCLEFRNLLGMTLKRVEFRRLSEFRVDEDRNLWHTGKDGVQKKQRIVKFGMRRSDLDRFFRAIEVKAFE